MKSVSTVHGLALSAWAFAGLSGNQLASFVVSHTADAAHRYSALIPIITVLYAIALRVHHRRGARHEGQARRRSIELTGFM